MLLLTCRSVLRPLLMLLMAAGAVQAQIFLPGTQPNENGIRVGKVKLCKSCHSNTGDENAEPYGTWQGGMMAQASRDPVYLAARAIANQDLPGSGEYCIRCHSPAGWLEGRSQEPDGSSLTKHDLHGVSCDICHRLVDPASPEAQGLAKDVPPGRGSGMMVMGKNKEVFGPYADSPEVNSHKTRQSDFQASSEMCGTCHDVSNPLAASDVKTQPPHTYGIVERTYSEWLLSDYSSGPDEKTCQSCHFPLVEGGGLAARHKSAGHRDYLVQHGPVGGSIWVQRAVAMLNEGEGVNPEALEAGIRKTHALLATAAKLEVTVPRKGQAMVRVTNLTGHKLPTGYIEGRRMWVNVKFLSAAGELLKEIGRYRPVRETIAGREVEVRSLTDAAETHVYECLPGLSEEQAAKYGKSPGKSFHFVLNDVITKDSRIPPKGFDNARFAERGCAPVGVDYADGQYWDDVFFELPEGCSRVEASLIHEPVTMEYIKFLVEENRSNDAGNKLFDVWLQLQDHTAAVIASASGAVSASAP